MSDDIFSLGYNKLLTKSTVYPTADVSGLVSSLSPGGLLSSSNSTISNPIGEGTTPTTVLSGDLSEIIFSKKTSFTDTTAGYRMGIDKDGIYKWIIGNNTSNIDWAVTTPGTLTINGVIVVTVGGSIGGFTIGTDYIRDSGNSFGLSSTVTGADDVRFWAGDTFANRATAPMRIYESGNANFATVTLDGSLSVSTSGVIKSGQTAYNTGVGYWWEYNGGTPRASIGNPAGNYLTWDGSALTVKGVIIATTATITGTSTDTFTINDDLTDANVDLIFGRTTGGNATLRWNGTSVSLNKQFLIGLSSPDTVNAIFETQGSSTYGYSSSKTVANTDNIFSLIDGPTVNTSSQILFGIDTTGLTMAIFDYTSSLITGSFLWVGANTTGTQRDFILANHDPKSIIFATTGTERMRLTSAGDLVLGASSSSAKIQVIKTTEQLRLGYDLINYASFTIGSGGNLTVAPTGDFVFDPTGNDILPNTGYDLNLGSLSKKYLTLYAAELWVETLVAQNTIATIGGRILVGPTTSLTSDLAPADTTIYVKHNEIANGDRIYLEANGSVEFMAVTSGPSGAGPYSYTVTRNLDGSGANQWYAGDAVFNTGTTGDGFIDIYSVSGIKGGTIYGPAITGNVRNSATYNDYTEHWTIGQLNGVYGYGVSTYGVAFGEYAASKTHITIDSTNGYRIFNGLSTVIGQWDISGNITVGEVGASKSNILISSNSIYLRTNTTNKISLDTSGNISLTGALSIGTAGSFSSGQTNYDTGTGFWMDYNTGTPRFSLGNSAGNKITWDGTTLTIVGGIDISSKLDKTGGAYASSASGARVLIFPDSNTGIQVIDDASNDVFKTIVGGTNVGDVIMGSESVGQYAKWDKSAGIFFVTGSNLVYPFTTGENITSGDSVIVGDGGTYANTQSSTDVNESFTDTTWYGQTFQLEKALNIVSVKVVLRNNNIGTKVVRLSLRAISAGLPTGSDLAYVDFTLPSGEVSYTERTFTFSPYTTTPNASYAFVLRNTTDNTTINVQANTTDVYTGGDEVKSTNSGSTWTNQSPRDLRFIITETSTVAGNLYKTDASNGINPVFYTNFIGFASETITSGNTCRVNLSNLNKNQSGLTVGVPYYLSNTPGAIATSAGDNSKKVGLSLSATTLLILNT